MTIKFNIGEKVLIEATIKAININSTCTQYMIILDKKDNPSFDFVVLETDLIKKEN